MATTMATESEGRRAGVRITVIVQDRYTLETDVVSAEEIRRVAAIPDGFALYRRVPGGNEPIHEHARIALRNGDHFFARRPPGGTDEDDDRHAKPTRP